MLRENGFDFGTGSLKEFSLHFYFIYLFSFSFSFSFFTSVAGIETFCLFIIIFLLWFPFSLSLFELIIWVFGL